MDTDGKNGQLANMHSVTISRIFMYSTRLSR